MSSHSAPIPRRCEARGAPGGSSAVWKVVVMLLGIAVGVLSIAAVVAVQAQTGPATTRARRRRAGCPRRSPRVTPRTQ